jgi:cytoskeletal protein CcmA (bactofilin family)
VSVESSVSNVNGAIKLTSATVNGDLTTVNGDVMLDENSLLKGTLTVKKPGGWNSSSKKPKVVIGPGSRVEGGIKLEREVELYISETAMVSEVTGVMSMDDAIRFSGSRP